MSKFLIIDGNSIINRAYYGIRPLTTKSGQPTNAVYGFLNIIFKYIEDEKPDGVCAAFDLKGPTFRHEFFKEYKAQRKGMPDDLAAQLTPVKELLGALGFPVFEVPGFEADDVIGTFSSECEKNNHECVILTGDKDDLQLAGEFTRIRLIRTISGKTTDDNFDVAKVQEVYGMTPAQFIDLKAIMGDKSDNIPGVPGIGEKGASDLIINFGSLDGVYENLDSDKIKPSARLKLKENKQLAYDSRFLSEIKKDVPINFDFENIIGKRDDDALIKLLADLELNSFISRFQLDSRKQDKEAAALTDFSVISGKTVSCAVLDKLYVYDGQQLYTCDDIKGFYKEPSVKKIVYDVKGDIIDGLSPQNVVFDVSLGAYVCDQSLAPITKDKVFNRYGGSSSNDAVKLYNCYSELSALLEANGQSKLYYSIELPLAYILADMQLAGVRVDTEVLEQLSAGYKKEIAALEAEIYELAGCEFNINSPKQLAELLYNKLMLPVYKKSKRGASTDAETLEKLEPYHPVIKKILEYRSVSKLNSTYIEPIKPMLKSDGRLHTNYNQSATQTGRLSSTEPNLQNIPIRTERGREIRRMFAPRDGFLLVDADYSQIELRVLAHMSGDENMINAFLSGTDIHVLTASHIFGVDVADVTPFMRSSAKAVNFGIIYGISEFTLAKNIGVTRNEAKKYIESYKARYPKITEFMTTVVEGAKENGYVETWFKRRRYIPELSASNFVSRSFGERAAMNAPVQGTAADIIKIAMINVYEKLKDMKSRLIMQIHDELVLEVPADELLEAESILKTEMENAVDFCVPLTVDVHSGNSLYDTK